MTFSLRRALSPPPRHRVLFWVAGIVTFVLLSATLLAWPQGRAAGDPTTGPTAEAELTGDVSVRLEPSLQDRGWRAAFPEDPYMLDLRATVDNAGDETFPRSITIRVVEDPGTSSERNLPERWSGSLQLADIPAGESIGHDLVYHAYGECGDFLATIDFVPSSSSGETEQIELPFTVGDEECREG